MRSSWVPRRIRSAGAVAAAALLCVAALAGCGSTAEAGTSPSAAAPASSARVVPSAPVAPPVLGPDGYGALRFGMTRAQAEAALGTKITGTDATGDGFCLLGTSPAAPGLTLGVVQGKVLAAAAQSGPTSSASPTAPTAVVTTVEGVRIGMSRTALLAVLPHSVTHRPYASAPGYTEYDVTVRSGVAESFQVDDATGAVTGFSYGASGYVVGAEFLCV
jgi:hypothetical protein